MGGVGGGSSNDSGGGGYQNDFTGGWSEEDKSAAGALAEDVAKTGVKGVDYSENSLAADAQRGVDTTTAIDKAIDATAPIAGMINPIAGLLVKTLGMFYDPDTHQEAAIKRIDRQSYSSQTSINDSAGLNDRGDGFGRAAKPVSAQQGIAVNTAPISQKELQTDQNEAQANPEEAAAMAEQEERKKARQRVGLMQMRAVDPLFIEGLPDIFRSRAV